MHAEKTNRPGHWTHSPWWRTPRSTALLTTGAFNRALDSVFYHVDGLSAPERASIPAHLDLEGAVAVVHPTGQNPDDKIPLLPPWRFLRDQAVAGRAEKIDTIVVPGVGSTALGAAAFARAVADARHRPVAAIVAGFGLADLLSEAWGGWFVLGRRNFWRDMLGRVFDVHDLKDHVRDDTSHAEMQAHFNALGLERTHYIFGDPDSATLLWILSRLGAQVDLIVGHSKGNLSIENALEGLLEIKRRGKNQAPVPTGIHLVTLGAVVDFPREFTNVHQFLGALDGLGLVNSRWFESWRLLPWATHTLNHDLPWHVDVTDALRRAGCNGSVPKSTTTSVRPPAVRATANARPAGNRVRIHRPASGGGRGPQSRARKGARRAATLSHR